MNLDWILSSVTSFLNATHGVHALKLALPHATGMKWKRYQP